MVNLNEDHSKNDVGRSEDHEEEKHLSGGSRDIESAGCDEVDKDRQHRAEDSMEKFGSSLTRGSTSTSSFPGAIAMRGIHRGADESSNEDDVSETELDNTGASTTNPPPPSEQVMISATLVDEEDRRGGDVKMVQAKPAPEGFRAIISNKRFKYLVVAVVVVFLAVIVPVAIIVPAKKGESYQCGTLSRNQADYRGTIAVTESGLPCQRWDSQEPHSHGECVLMWKRDAGVVFSV